MAPGFGAPTIAHRRLLERHRRLIPALPALYEAPEERRKEGEGHAAPYPRGGPRRDAAIDPGAMADVGRLQRGTRRRRETGARGFPRQSYSPYHLGWRTFRRSGLGPRQKPRSGHRPDRTVARCR